MEFVTKNGMNFTLRPPNFEDAQNLILYLNEVGGESDFLLTGSNEFNITLEEERAFIKEMTENPNNFIMIAESADKEIVGIITLKALSSKRVAHNCELGVSLRKKYWGLGLGTALMEQAIEYARCTDTLKVIHLTVVSTNQPALILYRKFGFEQLGVYKNQIRIGERYHDTVLMNLYL